MRVAVVGGGIAGLAAAWEAVRAGHDVVLLEADDRLGGKIRTSDFAGLPVDEGADAFITRTPAAVDLCAETGLDDLVSPATGQAYLWARGDLRPVPEGTVLGVPAELGPVAESGLLTEAGLRRAQAEPSVADQPIESDVSIGALVRSHYGDEVADYLVDPLLGGINAGGIDNLSVEVAAAQIAAVARRHPSLLEGLAELRAAMPPAGSGPPVFQAPAGGMERLVDAVVTALTKAGGDVRTGAATTGVSPGSEGAWRLEVAGEPVHADALVLAAPAHVAARLLEPVAPSASATLGGIEHAGVVLVTLAYERTAVPRPLEGSGFLVPKPEGRLLTACSWFSNKWAHLDDGRQLIVRASAGRYGDLRALELADADLVDRIHDELVEAMGLASAPTEVRISRWHGAFPQFRPGHLKVMDELEATLATEAPGVTLAGSYLRGVGIPACIAGGRAAARRLVGAGGTQRG